MPGVGRLDLVHRSFGHETWVAFGGKGHPMPLGRGGDSRVLMLAFLPAFGHGWLGLACIWKRLYTPSYAPQWEGVAGSPALHTQKLFLEARYSVSVVSWLHCVGKCLQRA